MNKKRIIPFPILQTNRLILRQLENFDKNELFLLRSDNHLNRYIERPKTISLEDAEAFIFKINIGISYGDWLYWGITLNGSNNLIGTICIWNILPDNESAEIGYELLSEFQGKGYAFEALQKVIDFGFSKLKLKTLRAYTHMDNNKSLKLLEKFNFKKNGKSETNLKEVIYEKIR